MKYIAIIEKYFFGNISERERSSFKRDLINNKELRREFERYKYLLDYINKIENSLKEIPKGTIELELDMDILQLISDYSTKDSLTTEEKDLLEKIKAKKESLDNKDDNIQYNSN